MKVQARKNRLDVAHEGPVRADDENAAGFAERGKGEGKPRGPVQRDGGLAGPWTALDDEYAGALEADETVLMALDSRSDVAHLTGTVCIERREDGVVDGAGTGIGTGQHLVAD